MTERQEKIAEVIKAIEINEEGNIKTWYSTNRTCYENIEKYLLTLNNPIDKLVVAQWANDYESAKKLFEQIEIPLEQKKLFDQLLAKNEDLYQTLNFEILSEKYSFLEPLIDIITTDINIQQKILSLSDDRLELLKKLVEQISISTNYPISYIDRVVTKIGYTPDPYEKRNHGYEELTAEMEILLKSGYPLTESDLERLLFIYCHEARNMPIKSLRDLRDINKIANQYFEKYLKPERNSLTPDVKLIKQCLLLTTYGITLDTAKIIKRKYNFSTIEITDDNVNVIEQYKAICAIVDETDGKKLLSIYDDFCALSTEELDFMQPIVMSQDFQKVFAQELTASTFKIENKNAEFIDNIPVYDAGIDFKMIVTAIGAYQSDFDNQQNYSDYWNSGKIQSHGNCCSLIANNNLAMATVRNVIFGFNSMDDSMLMAAGERDLASTNFSLDLYLDYRTTPGTFRGPEDLINNTRADYNELVYERRDLSKNATNFKKNPDYIVFIEEYENFEEWYERCKDRPQALSILQQQQNEQNKRLEESLKAAKDFGIPIVKINREKCAKNEISKIQVMLNEFRKNPQPHLINEIIMQYENNATGLCSPHVGLKSRYFPNDRMDYILDEIEKVINNIDNIQLRNNLLSSYNSALTLEKKKKDNAKGYKHNKQSSGINFTQRFDNINELQQIIQNPVEINEYVEINSEQLSDNYSSENSRKR